MLRTATLGVRILATLVSAFGLLTVRVHSQDVQQRVRSALAYPPLVAEVRIDFDFDLPLDHIIRAALAEEPAEKRVQRLRQQTERDPDNAEAWLELARAYEELLDATQEQRDAAYERAAALYQKLSNRSPKNATYLARLADALRGTGKSEDALPLARKAVQLDPKKAEHWEVMGRVALAIAGSKVVTPSGIVELDDKEAVSAAQTYLQEARAAYQQCLQRAPSSPRAIQGLAEVEAYETLLLAVTGTSEALTTRMTQLQQRFLQLPAGLSQGLWSATFTMLYLGAIYTAARQSIPSEICEQLEQGLESLHRVVRSRIDEAAKKANQTQRPWLELAQAMLEMLRERIAGEISPQSVARVARAIVTLNPKDRNWWRVLIVVAAAQDNWEEASRNAREALQRISDPEFYHWLIIALDKQGELDEANDAIDEFYRAYPEEVYALLFRSLQLMRMRGDDAALAQAGELIRVASRQVQEVSDPRWGPLETIRAVHLALTGNVEAARATIEQALRRYPEMRFAQQISQALQE